MLYTIQFVSLFSIKWLFKDHEVSNNKEITLILIVKITNIKSVPKADY